jgi:hypothetical protein
VKAIRIERLIDLAKTIRGKNAGVDLITFDVIFADKATYDRVCHSGALSRSAICRMFRIEPDRVTDHVAFDPAPAIKFTIRRTMPGGSLGDGDIFASPGDGDIFGSQHYGPLLDVEIPIGDPAAA